MGRYNVRILEIGLFPTLGGIESYTYNLVKTIDREKYVFDFWVIGNNGKTYFENQINALYGDDYNHFYYLPDLKKNLIDSSKMIKTLLDSKNYDLIYLNSDTSAKILYCLYAVLKQKKKLVIHCHSSNGRMFNHALFRPLMNKLCSHRIACSEMAANWMFGKSYADEVSIIANGVDTARFTFSLKSRTKIREKLNIKNNEILIGHIGRFVSVKNHKFIVKLVSNLPVNYKAILIGDGELKEEIGRLIYSMNLAERFIILSSRDNVEEYYSAMDVFVLPSIFEGLPIVAVEAQCSGLPCVLSESITRMCGVSSNCYYVELDIMQWKEKLMSISYERYDGVEFINKANLGIEYQAKRITDIFDRCIE